MNKYIISVVGDTHMEEGGAKWKISEELGEKLTTAGYRIMTGSSETSRRQLRKAPENRPTIKMVLLSPFSPRFDPSIAQDYTDIIIATG